MGVIRCCVFGKDTPISQQVVCVLWKTSAGIRFTTAYTGEKKLKTQIKKQANMILPVSSKAGFGTNCPMLIVYDVVPLIRRINRNVAKIRSSNKEEEAC